MEEKTNYLSGIVASEGITFGRAYLYRPKSQEIQQVYTEKDGIQQYEQSIQTAKQQLTDIYERLLIRADENAKIFEAQQEILDDEEMDQCVRKLIMDSRIAPIEAIEQIYEQFAEILSKAGDPLIAARTSDIRDVKLRLQRVLSGTAIDELASLPEGTVLVANDLLPSDTALLDPCCIAAIITEQGSQTAHTAILSRSLGIPALLAVRGAMDTIQTGMSVAVDAISGRVYCQPNEAIRSALDKKRLSFDGEKCIQQQYLYKKAVTTDGTYIQIGINIGGDESDFSSCDYCGLLRTEFLFLERQELPDEQTQFQQYKKIVENAQGKIVTLRTLDIGGDKALPYLPLPKEDNPFLGCRALRLCLEEQDIFRTQLRAALRASAYGKMQIMYPMVGSLIDYRHAKAITHQVMAELDAEGIAYDKAIPLGIMIEIPSIAQIADLAAEEVDFASVGTNDLCQYLCAADRLNAAVAQNYESYGPAMLRCLRDICRAFDRAGKPISICGELAGEKNAVELLVGMGYRKFSMNAKQHAAIKASICNFSLHEAQELFACAIKCRTQEEILELVQRRQKGAP